MSETTETPTKFYAATGTARLIVLGDDPIDAAIEIIGRLMDNKIGGTFGQWVYISETGFRGDDWAGIHSDTRAFSTWEILVTLGRLDGVTFERFLSIFKGGRNANENEESE